MTTGSEDFIKWAEETYGKNWPSIDPDYSIQSAWFAGREFIKNKLASILEEWVYKQSHARCWYYPDIFERLADELGVDYANTSMKNLPPLEEFKEGCCKYQNEQYGE